MLALKVSKLRGNNSSANMAGQRQPAPLLAVSAPRVRRNNHALQC